MLRKRGGGLNCRALRSDCSGRFLNHHQFNYAFRIFKEQMTRIASSRIDWYTRLVRKCRSKIESGVSDS
jgi:hypothetical protein